MKPDDIGTLCVLANRDNTLAKVGLTRNGTPNTRADDYSREHGFVWRVYWSATTLNVGEAEARAHRELGYCRWAEVPAAREIFYTTPSKAAAIAARCVTPVQPEAPLLPEAQPPATISEAERRDHAAAESPSLRRSGTRRRAGTCGGAGAMG